MYAAILLDPRLAFVLLCALLLAAAAPLAIAWARLLPEEPPSFRIHRALTYRVYGPAYNRESHNPPRDYFAVFLLFLVTLSFLCQVPGFPHEFVSFRSATFIPEPWLHGLILFCRGFLVVIPVLAAGYSLFRATEIRMHLIISGILVPLLWIVVPWLRAALLAS
jgi:hypothetical protein